MKTPQHVLAHLEHQFKLKMFKYAEVRGSCKEAYEAFGIKKTTFYSWKRKIEKDGEQGLLRKKRDCRTYWNSLSSDVVELILKLRSEYKLGTWRIKWYMEDIMASQSLNRVFTEL